MKQQTISDVEYSARKRKTKREEFLEIMGNHSMGGMGGVYQAVLSERKARPSSEGN